MITHYPKGFPVLTVLLGLLLIGCTSSEPPASKSAANAEPASSGPMRTSDFGLKFKAPEGWTEETPSSSMRIAQYRLQRVEPDQEDAELAVFYFRGGGGSAQANVDRWIGQFSKADGSPAGDVAQVSERDTSGIHLTIVDVNGTYKGAGGPMMQRAAPKPDYRLLAAVAEGSGGPWFFKLTGPRNTIDKWEASFYSLLDTLEVTH